MGTTTHTVVPVEEIIVTGFKHNVYKLTCGVFAVIDNVNGKIEDCTYDKNDAIETAETLDRRAGLKDA